MSIRSNRKKEEGRRAQSGISRMGDGNVSRHYNASEEGLSEMRRWRSPTRGGPSPFADGTEKTKTAIL